MAKSVKRHNLTIDTTLEYISTAALADCWLEYSWLFKYSTAWDMINNTPLSEAFHILKPILHKEPLAQIL